MTHEERVRAVSERLEGMFSSMDTVYQDMAHPDTACQDTACPDAARRVPAYDDRTPERLVTYHEMLTDWNTRMNLTGDTDFEVMLDRHFLDSLAPLLVKDLLPAHIALIDVGSGAGFPGLPLAIARPDLQVTLLDSLAKRVSFLNAVVKELGLTNVETLHARAEDAAREPGLREAFGAATARAVATLPVLCELLLPFARIGGRMIVWKGPAVRGEQEAGSRAASALGGGEPHAIPVCLPSQPDWSHSLVIIHKTKKTDRQYPRKTGIPTRRPLGGHDTI